jgi:hypothetical protein
VLVFHQMNDKVSKSKSVNISQKSDISPSNDHDIVRYLINKQKFDGLWTVDNNIMEKLTGKPFINIQCSLFLLHFKQLIVMKTHHHLMIVH